MFYHPEMISGRQQVNGTVSHAEEPATALSACQVQGDSSLAAPKLLIPIDGTRRAESALDYAIQASRNGSTSEIHIVHVRPLVMQGDYAFDDIVRIERQTQAAVGEQVVERARRLLAKNGVACHATVRFGKPAATILHYAREKRIGAIVMGMRSRGLLSRLLRPSVAAEVARMADVPVTILKSESRTDVGSRDGWRPAAAY